MSDSRNADEDKLSLETEEPERLPAGKATLEDNASEERSAEGETAAAAPTVEQLLQKVEELQQQYDREHDLHLRAVAELRNYQRRIAQQQAQQFQYATESLLTALVPVLDHCELALDAAVADNPDSELTQGVQILYQQLMDILAQFGLEPVEAAGEQFNPDLHEATQRQPVAAGDPAVGKVVEQLRRGYRLHERVLRPAQVKVAVAPEANNT